ncbi:MAG: oligosaccharide flippase family protein, partial [Sulfurimonas sp.]|nr:oligosaccharide flippase family protein [Sulfurimonas sp.]
MFKKLIILFNKIRKNNELILVGLSQVIGLISSIIFIKLVSHYASVSEYGLYSLVLSIAAFIALFPFTSFDQAISRYISIYHDEKTYPENYTNVLFLYILLITLLLLLFGIFYPFFESYISNEILKVFDILLVFSVVNIFKTTILQIENFNRNRKIVLYSRIFEGVVRILLLIAIIMYSSVTAYNILLISSIIFLINILVILFYRKDYLV